MTMNNTPHAEHEVDSFTGVSTTGHEWDGIKELNNPLPRWWLWTFYICIVWAIGYCFAYPSIPLINGATTGFLGWHSRSAVVQSLTDLQKSRGALMQKLASTPLDQIEQQPELLAFARAAGAAAFANNCAPCHGAGGQGSPGYPNLNANRWLWGGKLDQIYETIEHGVRSGDPKGHQGSMPDFGKAGILTQPQIEQVANYVRSLSGLKTEAGADLDAGAKVFADNCVPCHGKNAKGKTSIGSANLTTKVWLYGSDLKTIEAGVTNGHGGVMPYWDGRLDPTTIKALAIFVHTLGGGQ